MFYNLKKIKMEKINCPSFCTNLNKNHFHFLEKLRKMKVNYLKAKMDITCINEYDFLIKWLNYFISLDTESYIKIINDSSGEKIINKRSIRIIDELDVLNQNPFKLDDT